MKLVCFETITDVKNLEDILFQLFKILSYFFKIL